MVDQGYYRDQPHFSRKDPLATWSYIFLAAAGVAFLWLMLLLFLMATERFEETDRALGLAQGWWVAITTTILLAAIIGLFFIIIARIGATQAGSYLSAGVDDEPDTPDDDLSDDARDIVQTSETERLIASTEIRHTPHAARIEDPFGPDGRLLMSYTVPEMQPRGVYGDTYVLVDNDQVLNVKTLLAKTMRDE